MEVNDYISKVLSETYHGDSLGGQITAIHPSLGRPDEALIEVAKTDGTHGVIPSRLILGYTTENVEVPF